MNNASFSTQRLGELKERLKEHVNWFPVPALISFVLVLLFIGHLLVNINPRLGNSAVILTMDAELEKEGSIWLSISEKEGQLYLTTYDRKMFSWPSKTKSLEPLSGFKKFLETTTAELAAQAAVSKFVSKSQTKVVLAVDQRLRYYHVRPILHILAEVGLDSYAFETQRLKLAKNTEDSPGEENNNSSEEKM
ncbi:hypothetical protein N9W79_02130 [bacterium]|nr:hypothetical protein [bacterium]